MLHELIHELEIIPSVIVTEALMVLGIMKGGQQWTKKILSGGK